MNYRNELQRAYTYRDVARVNIKVNREIDRVSDHSYKQMGGYTTDERFLARAVSLAMSLEDFKEATMCEIEILEAIMMMPIGGNVIIPSEEGLKTYRRIA